MQCCISTHGTHNGFVFGLLPTEIARTAFSLLHVMLQSFAAASPPCQFDRHVCMACSSAHVVCRSSDDGQDINVSTPRADNQTRHFHFCMSAGQHVLCSACMLHEAFSSFQAAMEAPHSGLTGALNVSCCVHLSGIAYGMLFWQHFFSEADP